MERARPTRTADASQRSTVHALRTVGQALLRLPRWLSVWLPVLWAAGILSMSSRTVDLGWPRNLWTAWLGNGVHAFEFGVLALLALPLLRRRADWVDWRGIGPRILVLACCGLALLDEWTQSGVIGRSASLWDALTDAVGILVSCAMAFLLTDPNYPPRRLHRAILAGLLLCAAAAALSTAWDWNHDSGWWPLPRRS